VTGVILSDAVKNLDWRARNALYLDSTPPDVLQAVQQRLGLLLGFDVY
jgi:mRNA interferase MazF